MYMLVLCVWYVMYALCVSVLHVQKSGLKQGPKYLDPPRMYFMFHAHLLKISENQHALTAAWAFDVYINCNVEF